MGDEEHAQEEQPDSVDFYEAARQMECTVEDVERLIRSGRLEMVRGAGGMHMVRTPLPHFRKSWRGRLYGADERHAVYGRYLSYAYLVAFVVIAVLVFTQPRHLGLSLPARVVLLAVVLLTGVVLRYLVARPPTRRF